MIEKHAENPYFPYFLGIGYIGEGNYSSKGSNRKIYSTWLNMLLRCYDNNFYVKRPTYTNCTVDKRWHNFQVFAEWYENNFVEGFHLDKDILLKDNKIYSPETCCFVPREINLLFTKSGNVRGKYPIGVHMNKRSNKLESGIKKYGKRVYLGLFNTPELAFQAYKIAKESYIKELAEKWKPFITKPCYQALINYKVEITD